MTGPEHYKAAEDLLDQPLGENPEHAWRHVMVAQVHATLALAAGTALITDFNGSEQYAWHQVAGKAKS